ncbi:MAG: amidohydrolase family protein [Pseudomonadales bacterium]|jgi:N-acyl-D-aspartate/D-glutamate deacylase
MEYDIIIRNGTVVDGTGDAPRMADVAIKGDRIAAIGDITDDATMVIDAKGAYVTPGFVDIHTHLDAQIAWDPIASSSCYHGVTSVVMGNCGVSFAPCKPEDREYLSEMMESVEDIPKKAIQTGLPWNWETYGEYLAAIERMPKGVNVGGMVGHCAVRYYVMGERSLDEAPATGEDIEEMKVVVKEAIDAGALGFSTSRTFMHKVPDGRPVPGTYAQPEELLAIGEVMGAAGRGVFEAAARLGERDNQELTNTRAEIAWMGELSRRNNVNITFGLTQSDRRPQLYQSVIDFSEEENANGSNLRPQTTSRGIGALMAFLHRTPFDGAPAWRALRKLSGEEKMAILADEQERQRLVDDVNLEDIQMDFEKLFVLMPDHVRYDMDPSTSLAEHARQRGVDPVTAFLEISLETQGKAVFTFSFLNQQMDAVESMLNQPIVAMGLADSGAHVGQIMDASQPTWLLKYWVKEKGLLSIEDAIRRWTSDTAAIFGIKDRGTLAVGMYADVNVINLDELDLGLPEYVYDFPHGAGRYIQRAKGYQTTLVNGQVFMKDGEPTGNLAGLMLQNR